VDEILKILDKAISDQPQLTPKEALGKLVERFEFQELEPDEKPTKAEALKVIDKLAELVRAQKVGKKGLFEKNPGLGEKRLQALKILREWLAKDWPENSAIFPQVNLNRLGIHLGLRVVKPRAIHQGDYGFCGPVTILYPLNKTEPEKYVKY